MEAKAETSKPTAQEKPKRHLRNLLLETGFQLRWVLRVVVATSLIVTVMGFFLYQTVGNATDQLLAQQLDDPMLTREGFDAFVKQAKYDKGITLFKIAGGLISLVVLLGGLTIVYTHKIAGPIHKLKMIFATIDGENLQFTAKLRKSDEFQDTYIDFESMLRRVREARQDEIHKLENIRTLLNNGEDPDKLVKLVDNMLQHFKRSVKAD